MNAGSVVGGAVAGGAVVGGTVVVLVVVGVMVVVGAIVVAGAIVVVVVVVLAVVVVAGRLVVVATVEATDGADADVPRADPSSDDPQLAAASAPARSSMAAPGRILVRGRMGGR